MKYNTYKRLTLEFLSSIKVNVLYRPGCEDGEITFRLFNEEHNLTLETFNGIYGLPCGGDRRTPRDFHAHDL